MSRDGEEHLLWVTRFQAVLLVVGALLWLLRSRDAAVAFAVAGLTSLAFWALHRFLTGRMLTPSVRRRWLYAFLSLGKLALIAVVLRGMMGRYPAEALPITTGILLFVAGILLEAVRLAFQRVETAPPD